MAYNQHEERARVELLKHIDLIRDSARGFDVVLEETFHIENLNELTQTSVVRLQEIADYFDDLI